MTQKKKCESISVLFKVSVCSSFNALHMSN